MEKFLSNYIKQKEGVEISQLPEFITKKLNSQKNEFLQLNLSQFHLQNVNSIFSRKDNDLSKKLEDIDFEIDFGSYEFQRKFYQKYIVIKYRNSYQEKDKAEKLQIRVVLNNQNSYTITKNQLGQNLKQFRKIYKSFCELISYLSDKAVKDFEKRFYFETFLKNQELFPENLQAVEEFNDFGIKWVIMNEENKDKVEKIEETVNADFIKIYLINLFKPHVFQTIRIITGVKDLNKEKIIAILIRKHQELFEYYIKNYCNNKNVDISKQLFFLQWKIFLLKNNQKLVKNQKCILLVLIMISVIKFLIIYFQDLFIMLMIFKIQKNQKQKLLLMLLKILSVFIHKILCIIEYLFLIMMIKLFLKNFKTLKNFLKIQIKMKIFYFIANKDYQDHHQYYSLHQQNLKIYLLKMH